MGTEFRELFFASLDSPRFKGVLDRSKRIVNLPAKYGICNLALTPQPLQSPFTDLEILADGIAVHILSRLSLD